MPFTFESHTNDFLSSSSFKDPASYIKEDTNFRYPAGILHWNSAPKEYTHQPGFTVSQDTVVLPRTLSAPTSANALPIYQPHGILSSSIVSSSSVNGTSGPPFTDETSSNKRPRTRTRTACDSCRKRKTQCDGARPCQKCQHYDRPCVYEDANKEPGNPQAFGFSRESMGAVLNLGASEDMLPQGPLLHPVHPLQPVSVPYTAPEHASVFLANIGANNSAASAQSSISATPHVTSAFQSTDDEGSSQNATLSSKLNNRGSASLQSSSDLDEPFSVATSITGLRDRISSMEQVLLRLDLRLSSPDSNGMIGGVNLLDTRGTPTICERGLPNPSATSRDHVHNSRGSYLHPGHQQTDPGTKDASPTAGTRSSSSEQTSFPGFLSMQTAIPLPEMLAHAAHLRRILAPEGSKICVLSGPRMRMTQTFTRYSLVSVLSEESASWFRTKIRLDPQVGRPLENVYTAFTNMVQTMADRWRSLTSSAVPNHPYLARYAPDLIDEILHCWYPRHPWASFICPYSTVSNVFRQYRLKGAPDQPFYVAEVLVMHISVALAIANRAPADTINPATYPALAAALEPALHAIKADCYNTAVAILNSASQGCESILHLQAISLMLLYNQSAYILDLQSGYMLASTMVRFAQQMGYHIIESFENEGTPHDRELKRRLWWLCSVSAIDMAFDTGKAMISNPQQLSTLSTMDNHYLADSLYADGGLGSAETLRSACLEATDAAQMYFAHFRLRLSRIKERVMLELCGPHSKSLPVSKRAAIMHEVNCSLMELAQAMDPAVRPVFLTLPQVVTNDFSPPIENCPSFLVGKAHVRLLSFEFKLAYLSCVSLLNRIPFFEAHELSTEQAIACGDLAVNASRAVMALVSCTPILPLWPRLMTAQMVQMPLVLYAGLLSTYLAHPQHPYAVIDCRVLVQVSMKFFITSSSILPEQWSVLRKMFTRPVMADFLARFFLRILVTEIADKANHDYCKRVPGLSAHLSECLHIYPDIFKPTTTVRSTISFAFEKNLDATDTCDDFGAPLNSQVSSGAQYRQGSYGEQVIIQRGVNGWHENQCNESFDGMLSNTAMNQQLLDMQAHQGFGPPK